MFFASRNPRDGEPSWAAVSGLHTSWTSLKRTLAAAAYPRWYWWTGQCYVYFQFLRTFQYFFYSGCESWTFFQRACCWCLYSLKQCLSRSSLPAQLMMFHYFDIESFMCLLPIPLLCKILGLIRTHLFILCFDSFLGLC